MKNIVIFGGTGGIGLATARLFLNKGDRVLISGTNKRALEKLTKNFDDFVQRGDFFVKEADITNLESVVKLKKYTLNNLGGCDVLINSAGVFKDGLLHESTEEDFDSQFNVNVKGTYFSCKAFIPMMLENNGGAIINVASVSGIGGDYNSPLYSASKAAIINLTRAIALDYAEKNIRINVVSPSATKTNMFMSGSTQEIIDNFTNIIPNRQLGNPEDVAEVIKFLASEEAYHVRGQNIAIDGGLSAWSGQPKQDKQ